MNALLVITVIALQDDGAITRQRDMHTFKSMDECQAEMRVHAQALGAAEGAPRQFTVACVPMATIEVLEPSKNPAPAKPAEKPLITPERTS